MNEPLVSIIIPCYNAASTVGESVASALHQTYKQIEIIVVDDGSTDGSLSELRKFGTDIVLIEGQHKGGNAARNRGLAEAKGEWIQFLDADDILYPEKLERQVPVAASNPDKLVFCKGSLRNDNKVNFKEFGRGIAVNIDAIICFLSERIPILAPLHRRDRLQAVGGFREDLPSAQEFDLHMRLAANGCGLMQMPEFFYEIRLRKTSVSSNYVRVIDEYEKIIMPVFKGLQMRGWLTDERRAAFARFMANAGRLYMRYGCRSKGNQYFELAKSMDHKAWMLAYDMPARFLRIVIGSYLLEKLVVLKRMVSFRRSGMYAVLSDK